MTSIEDLGPETVTLRGRTLEVPGVSVNGLLALLARFPRVKDMISETGFEGGFQAVLALGPEFLPALLAAGLGAPGDPEREAWAARLGLADQAKLFRAVLAATMPEGVDPFLETLNGIVSQIRSDRPSSENEAGPGAGADPSAGGPDRPAAGAAADGSSPPPATS